MRQVPAKMASKLYGAAELIAERGLADAKIEEIAEATGVPKATLYYYFTGKEEILAFLLNDLLELIAGEVGTAVSSSGTTAERLQAAVAAQLSVMFEHPALCTALVGDLGRATRLPELAASLNQAFHEPLESLLREGVDEGTLRAVREPATVALSIFGAVTVVGLSAAVEAPSARPDPSTTAADIVDLLLRGLRDRSPHSG